MAGVLLMHKSRSLPRCRRVWLHSGPNAFLSTNDSGLYADSARNAIAQLKLKLDTLVQEAESLSKGGLLQDADARLDSAWRIDSSDRRVRELRRE